MAGIVERESIAKRRDLSDQMAVADQKKTVFTSMVRKDTGPENVLVEWPVDEFPAPSTEGAVDEADRTTFENLGAPAGLLENRLQIWERAPKSSRLAEVAMNQAGVGKKKAYAKAYAKGLIMIKRDIEVTCLSDNEVAVETANSGNKMRGLGKWIQSTAQSLYPVDTGQLTPAASIITTATADVTDDDIVGMLKSRFDETGISDDMIYGIVGSTLKQAYARLVHHEKANAAVTVVRRFNQDAAAKKITQKIDVLETEFGTVALRLSSFINTGGDATTAASRRLGYFFGLEDVSLKFAQEPTGHELANGGGGKRALIDAIGTLRVTTPLKFAKHAASA